MHTVPYHIFKDEIAKHLIAQGTYDQAWFEEQSGRIIMWHEVGETLDGAKEMMAFFAANRNRQLTPKQIAQKYGAYHNV